MIDRGTVLWRYLLLTWLALVCSCTGFLEHVPWSNALYAGFALAAYCSYMLFYLTPVFLPLWLAHRLATRPRDAALCARLHGVPEALLWGFAVVGTTLVHLALYVDLAVLRIWGFHLNGFVWNLLTTPGGIESLEASRSTYGSFGMVVSGLLGLHLLLLLLARSVRLLPIMTRPPRRRVAVGLTAGIVLLSAFERLTFCASWLTDDRPVLEVADSLPLYVPLHSRWLGNLLEVSVRHDPDLTQDAGDDEDDVFLSYPTTPLQRAPDARNWNIVWLVAESLRADALNTEVMPRTCAFAERATRFEHHFSAGNGTRMALFGMFYGLYGNAWFPILRAAQSPVLMDVLLDAGYDVRAFTSAKFTYPEFDRTIFAKVPPERLREGDEALASWQNDRANVGELLSSLDGRDPGRPFFRFMFFESPHARYDFPPDAVIRENYLQDLNYAKLDFSEDVESIRNRYLNSCFHLDSQYGRVLDGLAERGLLESTIVILTGDHGEEFLEHGRWGHNSDFTDEQVRTPLVIWVPGRAPATVTRMSSHHDLPATVLALLGVTTPEAEYTLGHDLFGPVARERCVISAWDEMALVDARTKFVVPFRAGKLAGSRISTAEDGEVPDEEAARAAARPFIVDTLAEMSRFLR